MSFGRRLPWILAGTLCGLFLSEAAMALLGRTSVLMGLQTPGDRIGYIVAQQLASVVLMLAVFGVLDLLERRRLHRQARSLSGTPPVA